MHSKRHLIFALILTFAISSRAADSVQKTVSPDDFCMQPTMIENLKQYFSCRQDTSILSCGGLAASLGAGAIAGGTMGAFQYLSKPTRDKIIKNLSADANQIKKDIAENLRDADRAPREIKDSAHAINKLKAMDTEEDKLARQIMDLKEKLNTKRIKGLDEKERISKLSKAQLQAEIDARPPSNLQSDLIDANIGTDTKKLSNLELDFRMLESKRRALEAAIPDFPGRGLESHLSYTKYDKPIYDPDLQPANGGMKDIANGSLDHSPPVIQEKYNKMAGEAFEQMMKQVRAGGSIHDPKFMDAAVEQMAKSFVAAKMAKDAIRPGVAEKAAIQFTEKARTVAKQALDEAASTIESTSTKMLGNSAKKILAASVAESALGSAAASRAAGLAGEFAKGALIGVASGAAADVLLSASATGCDTMDVRYMTVDEKCKPVYALSQKNVDFFNLSRRNQLEILKDPKQCDYYKKLYSSLLKTPPIRKLTCSAYGLRAEFYATGSDEPTALVLKTDSFHGPITSAQFYTGSTERSIDFDSKGKPAKNYTNLPDEQYKDLQLTVPFLRDCCTADDGNACGDSLNHSAQMGKTKFSANPVTREWGRPDTVSENGKTVPFTNDNGTGVQGNK